MLTGFTSRDSTPKPAISFEEPEAGLVSLRRAEAIDAGSVLIIGKSTSPPSQQRFASQIPGAVTVEAVDLRDLVTFARDLNMDGSRALLTIGEFAEKVMTNVGAADLVRRVDAIVRGVRAGNQARSNFLPSRLSKTDVIVMSWLFLWK
jgi:hypothetical protein